MSATQVPEISQNDSEGLPESLMIPPDEVTKMQILYATHDNPDLMQRSGIPTDDTLACETAAVTLMQRYDVREVFIVTVHAAYVKETNIRRAI